MVEGVSKGFEKNLELIGVGYRAQKQGKKLVLNVGYSHPIELSRNQVLKSMYRRTRKSSLKVSTKRKLAHSLQTFVHVRPPEPYKGKGIRYEGEHVRRKEGKTGK